MTTERLYFRKASKADSDFIYALVNDSAWLAYIGDRGINNGDEAIRFINENLNAKQKDYRLGLRICCIKQNIHTQNVIKDTPIGLCGLLQRDYLDSIDIGYAVAKEYRGHGYALESARFFTEFAFMQIMVSKLYATVSKENIESISILEKLGYKEVNSFNERNSVPENILLFKLESSRVVSPR